MKKIDLGQTITILANLGVIAGIIFLGIELQQNNELMEAEARRARALSSEEAYRIIAENEALAEMFVKEERGEALTDVESQRMRSFWLRGLTDLQLAHAELPENEWGPLIERFRLNHRLFPALHDTWTRRKAVFSGEFVQWYEENVVSHE